MENSVVIIIFSLALVLITMNILVYSFAVAYNKYCRAGMWVVNVTAVIPGFLAVCYGLYIRIIDDRSDAGWALFAAGMLLETGAIQLTILMRKKLAAADDAN